MNVRIRCGTNDRETRATFRIQTQPIHEQDQVPDRSRTVPRREPRSSFGNVGGRGCAPNHRRQEAPVMTWCTSTSRAAPPASRHPAIAHPRARATPQKAADDLRRLGRRRKPSKGPPGRLESDSRPPCVSPVHRSREPDPDPPPAPQSDLDAPKLGKCRPLRHLRPLKTASQPP
jgi:hypothetical protein